jgi:4a-hydroxytetrahydrobiopterin dehydratase
MIKCLNKVEISERMKNIDAAWFFHGNSIEREFIFKNFKQAFEFMTAVSIVAEALNHHPNWSNAYHKVFISLTTHDSGGLTELDFNFAKEVDDIYKSKFLSSI